MQLIKNKSIYTKSVSSKIIFSTVNLFVLTTQIGCSQYGLSRGSHVRNVLPRASVNFSSARFEQPTPAPRTIFLNPSELLISSNFAQSITTSVCLPVARPAPPIPQRTSSIPKSERFIQKSELDITPQSTFVLPVGPAPSKPPRQVIASSINTTSHLLLHDEHSKNVLPDSVNQLEEVIPNKSYNHDTDKTKVVPALATQIEVIAPKKNRFKARWCKRIKALLPQTKKSKGKSVFYS